MPDDTNTRAGCPHPRGDSVRLLIVSLVMVLFVRPAGAADTFTIAYEQGRVVSHYPEGTRPVVGLALSGGGARGIAHVGVIEVLEEEGIPIERIAGTSMGSIIGGLYAAGYSTESLTTVLETTDWSQYFSNTPSRRSIYVSGKEAAQWPLFDLRFHGFRAQLPSSLSSGQKISSILTWLAAGPGYESGGDFDRLPVPFRAVATDLTPPGSTEVLAEGNLARAIQASATVPLLFTPVDWEGKRLVDGGLTNNLPVDVVRGMGSDFVIGVAIDESMHSLNDLDSALNIADQATSILMRQVTNQKRLLADVLINPDMETFSSSDFESIPGMIEAGRAAARQAMPELKRRLGEAAAGYRVARVTGITATPQSSERAVMAVLSSEVPLGEETSCAAIAYGLERLWETGAYMSIRATLGDDGVLAVETTRAPALVEIEYLSGGEPDGPGTVIDLAASIVPPPFTHTIARIDSLLRQYKAEGRTLAAISASIYEPATRTLRIRVESPVVARIGIAGDPRSRRTLITREYRLHPGDPFDLDALMTTVDNLYGTNLFELVYTDIEPVDGGVGITIHVTEKNWTVVRLGIRYDEIDQAVGRAVASQENIFGFGNDLSFLGQYGERKKTLMIETQADRIYNSLYTFNLKTYRLERQRPVYDGHKRIGDFAVTRYGSVVSLGQQMETLGNALLQFKTETVWITYPRDMNRKNEKKEFRSIIAASVIDSYDQYPFPYHGYTNVLYIESANEFFGGTEQYVKMYWGGSYVVSRRRKHALIGRFALGSADRSMPAINSFTLGGNPTRLNAYDTEAGRALYYADFLGLNTEERYGNYLASGSLTYRLFIPRYFYLSLIYQAGNVWDNNETITAQSLLQAYGIDGTFATFLGPLSIGWGITSEGDDRVHMSAGWEF